MKITELAIKRSIVVIILVVLMIFSGLSAYKNIPKAEDPGFVIRTAVVVTYFPGASPKRVEMLVTDKLEKAIQEMPELDYVKSESKAGVSIVYVNIKESYKKLRPIWDSLRRKVDTVRPLLPKDIAGPYVNDEFGDVFGTVVAIKGDGYSYAELKDIADDVRDEFLRLDEVAKVEIFGAQDERIFIDFDNNKLAKYGLTALQLRQILESKNIIIPGGDITVNKERIILEPSGNLESVEELQNAIINIPQSDRVIYLQDIANIYRGYVDPPNNLMKYNGEPCLGLAISLREGGNIIKLGEEVKTSVERIQKQYPLGLDVDVAVFQPEIVQKKIDEFTESLILAVVIVVVVLLVALGLRTGFIVASLIPVVILIVFSIMNSTGIWMDQMSLAALIIVLGMLVDTSIVISESILVQTEAGKSTFDAVMTSTKELTFPLLVSVLSISAAFLPIKLADSVLSEYCGVLFDVVFISLIVSLLLSITLVPILCCYFLKVKREKKDGKDNYTSIVYKFYRSCLITVLKHPYISIAIIVGIFIVALNVFKTIPNIFFPTSNRPLVTIECKLPVGTPIQETEKVISEIENYMKTDLMANKKHPEGILNWASFIGRGAPRFVLTYAPENAAPEYAIIIANFTSIESAKATITKLEDFCKGKFPDLRAKIKLLVLGAPYEEPVEIRISGKDTDKLFAIADKVKDKLRKTEGTKDVYDNWGKYTKKFLVEIDPEKAFRAGITNQDIAISLQTSLSGFGVTEYREDDKIIPVLLRVKPESRQSLSQLEDLNVFVQSKGMSIPLKQVAKIKPDWQPAKIYRWDRLKTVTAQSSILPGYTSKEIIKKVLPYMHEISKDWDLGYSYEVGGENEKSDKANKAMGDKIPMAGMIICLLLLLQFNGIRKPLIIFLTVPLGLIGVAFGLKICGSYFGFMTFLGTIALCGIVINNAVVLIDRIGIEIDENGLEPSRALVEAGQRRLRPILLTASCTIGGLIPLWLGSGPMWKPMAIAIIFGLAFATILTLGVIPVLYRILYNVNFKDFKY